MRELTKSAAGFSWAMSLLGADQAIHAFAPGRVQRSLYPVRQKAALELDDVLWAAYQAGDQLQRGIVDLAWKFATLQAFQPDTLRRITSDIVWQSAETARSLVPGTPLQLAWRQLRNNYEVYNLVKQVRALLQIPAGPDLDLGALVEKAYALGEYPDLWAVEGLGHDYADRHWDSDVPLRGLLTGDRAAALPAKSLTMMHAGIGLCFAQRLMPTLSPYSPESRIADTLRTFIGLCRENSRPGYTGAALESLGLVTRTWHADLVPVVDRCLCAIDPDAASYFWHGAGRALYFLPIYFVPGGPSPWLAVNREAPHEIGRRNQAAGLAWATTLVNMRQPQIVQELLHRHGAEFAADDSFANGVASSMVMGWDITPGDMYIQQFARFRSAARDWERLVGQPSRNAVERYHPALQSRGRLEEVFHYCPLDELVAQLEGGAG